MKKNKLIPLDLSTLSEEVIEVFLLDSTREPSLFEEIAQKNVHRPKILKYLLTHPLTPRTTRQFVAQTLQVPIPEITTEETTTKSPAEEVSRASRVQNLYQRIWKLKIGEKIQLAIKGSREIRSILLRDPNKEVMLTVLENPKITESEIEILAKQRTSPDEVLRTIAKNREWLRSYSIVHALVTNPKTPTAIAVKHLRTLKHKDLKLIEKNRNIPEAIRAVIKKIIKAKS